MFISDPGLKRSRICIKEFKYLYPQFSKIRSEMFISDPGSGFFAIPDPGLGPRGQKSTGSWIRNTAQKNEVFFTCCEVFSSSHPFVPLLFLVYVLYTHLMLTLVPPKADRPQCMAPLLFVGTPPLSS